MNGVQVTQLYCVADRTYYESPDRLPDTGERYPVAGAAVPPGWRRAESGLWIELKPDDHVLPDQGWKIHVSARPDNATKILDAVLAICLETRAAMKFLRSDKALRFMSGKYMPRHNSGKFITVYPADEDQLAELLTLLLAAVDGEPGPYILGDLRVGRGPVHVRYGAFVRRMCPGPDGTPVPALRDPRGTLVPDRRRPVFEMPAWVRPPECLTPHLTAREFGFAADFPYRVERALYFTNAGGIYLAEHRETGRRVVLREARPHSGLDEHGTDAVTRLGREYEVLRTLSGLDCVPRVYELTRVWEHEFLVEEYIEGQNLLAAVISRYPLRFVDPDPGSIAAYARWAQRVCAGLSDALTAVHAAGVTVGDLHPGNIIVRPDDSVALIDLEYAGDAASGGGTRMGAPGFAAPADATAAEADRYSLRAIWLMMLMPVSEMVDHDPGKVATLESIARELFGAVVDAGPPLPRPQPAARPSAGEQIVTDLFDRPVPHWPAIRDQLVSGILDAATPDRDDRLFPGDLKVFADQGAAFAHGAAGILLALHRVGAHVDAGHVDWLIAAAARTRHDPGGLFDGLPGVAVTLDALGRRAAAREVWDRCRESAPATPGLFSGLAGLGLAAFALGGSTGDPALIDDATDYAWRLDAMVDRCRSSDVGLLRGMTGAALLQLRLFGLTGDGKLLDASRRALGRDLDHCVRLADGTVHVRTGARHLPYVDGGSGGIALVAREYLAHRHDAELADFVRAARRTCGHEHVREPGLFQGRAGLLAVLGGLADVEEVLPQVRRLRWHAVHRDGHLLIPGARLRRFSADVATGSAGVLLALHSVFDRAGAPLRALLPC